MKENNIKHYASVVVRMGIFPLIFYFILFCILTYPLIIRFSSFFFSDNYDGIQNIWNIWWVNKAVTELHQLPWHTTYLHYPYGVSLLGHTLNPFNGFLSILLLKFLTLVQTYNFIFVFSFVFGGLTSFLLAYYFTPLEKATDEVGGENKEADGGSMPPSAPLENNFLTGSAHTVSPVRDKSLNGVRERSSLTGFTKSYWGSIIAGFIFTFSNYHFSHAAHLQLVSLEWIPLFMLFWFMFITRPRFLTAIASAISLFLITLCDYYYLLYSILIGCLIVIWHAFKKKDLFFLFKGRYLMPFVIFILGVFVTVGPLMISLLFLNLRDPLLGFHNPEIFSTDLLEPLVPGYFWRFSNLTQCFWLRLLGDQEEHGAYLGVVVIFLLIYLFARRCKFKFESLSFWYFSLIFFFVMSLGPVLHIWGRYITYLGKLPLIMPYLLFEVALPPLKISGCPARMMIMVILSASVICAMGFKAFFEKSLKKILLTTLLIIILFFEYLPRSVSSFSPFIPELIKILKDLPDNKGVLDIVAHPALVLYYQTIHEKPVAFGYVSRIPKSTDDKDSLLAKTVVNKDYVKLYCEYNIRYLIVPVALDVKSDCLSVETLYRDSKVKLYDLGKECKCCNSQ